MERPDDTDQTDRSDALLVPACVTSPCRDDEDGAARRAADESTRAASQPSPGFQGKNAAASSAGPGIPAPDMASSSTSAVPSRVAFCPEYVTPRLRHPSWVLLKHILTVCISDDPMLDAFENE
jgi:hypothetical protein